MKKIFILIVTFVMFMGCYEGNSSQGDNMFYLLAGNQEMACEFADSTAARELKEILLQGEITINMENYGGFEKVGELPKKLSQNDESINAVSGDILLYQGRYMVIMYGNNSWSYTRLGKIKGLSSSEIYSILSKAGNNIKVYMK